MVTSDGILMKVWVIDTRTYSYIQHYKPEERFFDTNKIFYRLIAGISIFEDDLGIIKNVGNDLGHKHQVVVF